MSSAQLKFTTVPVTSKYGWRVLKLTNKPNQHKGTDTATGSEYAHSVFGDGVVKFAGRRKYGHPDYERGIHVIVEHAPGIETSYHSLSNLAVVTGQPVKMGDIIGYAGKSAVGASGNHVHNGLWLNGAHVDPLKYLTPGKVVTVSNTGTVSGGNATAFDNSTPTVPPVPKETDMKVIHQKVRGYALIWDEGAYGYPNGDVARVVTKGLPVVEYEFDWQWDTEVREANLRGDAMRAIQTAHTLKALQAAGVPVNVDEAAIAKATAALLPDVGAIVAEIVKALPKTGVTAEQIAAELSKRLAS